MTGYLNVSLCEMIRPKLLAISNKNDTALNKICGKPSSICKLIKNVWIYGSAGEFTITHHHYIPTKNNLMGWNVSHTMFVYNFAYIK